MNKNKKLLSQRNPIFYFLAVWYRRIIRYKQWYFSSIKFAKFEGGRILDTELVAKNCALVKYTPEEFK